MHPACLSADQLLQQCQIRRQRRSGPGGQHRNKVETAIVLRHNASGLEAAATERRSQSENRRVALRRLRLRLALRLRTQIGPAEFSARWQDRIVGNRIQVGPRHEDFPAILADVLDLVCVQGADIRSVARDLPTTSSQIVRFLKLEPKAFELVNAWRSENGLKRLR